MTHTMKLTEVFQFMIYVYNVQSK